ncbi:hypothetical protein FACS1894167_05930 [Synergistales bacterium]|nr:hypothetical protein FACS1894167_05930 [Synergistales bacterium]
MKVGKSMVSLTLIQFLIDKYGEQKTIHLIETDESNPDVGRVYKNKIPVTTAILDEDEKDWIRMAGVMENTSDTLFVINSAARSTLGVRKHGRDFNSVLESGQINYDLVTLWPLNRQKDSVLLLEDFLEYISFGHISPFATAISESRRTLRCTRNICRITILCALAYMRRSTFPRSRT